MKQILLVFLGLSGCIVSCKKKDTESQKIVIKGDPPKGIKYAKASGEKEEYSINPVSIYRRKFISSVKSQFSDFAVNVIFGDVASGMDTVIAGYQTSGKNNENKLNMVNTTDVLKRWTLIEIQSNDGNTPNNIIGNAKHKFLSWSPVLTIYNNDESNRDTLIFEKPTASSTLVTVLHYSNALGIYDTVGQCLYELNGQPEYDRNFVTFWLLECMTQFSNTRFQDITTYLSAYFGQALVRQSYIKNNVPLASYQYEFKTDSIGNITFKKVTDHNGNISTVTFEY